MCFYEIENVYYIHKILTKYDVESGNCTCLIYAYFEKLQRHSITDQTRPRNEFSSLETRSLPSYNPHGSNPHGSKFSTKNVL